jgi:hypothetical protein
MMNGLSRVVFAFWACCAASAGAWAAEVLLPFEDAKRRAGYCD